jgi:restriction system protein
MIDDRTRAFQQSLRIRGLIVAIPDFQSLMLPLLQALADGKERTPRELAELLADQFGLTEEERGAVLSSGKQTFLLNRVSWSRSHLKAAGLLESPARKLVRITEAGRGVLLEKPSSINIRFLMRFPRAVYMRVAHGARLNSLLPLREKVPRRGG